MLSHFSGRTSVALGIVDDTLRDLQLLSRGVRLVYAPDPAEIVDFCFPFGVDASSTRADMDPDSAADSQIALYHGLFGWIERPLLLDAYVGEVGRVRGYLQSIGKEGFRKFEVAEKFLAGTGASTAGLATDKPELLDFAATDLHIAVAIALGLFQKGVDWFQQVLDTRIVRRADLPSDPGLISRQHVPLGVAEAIIPILERELLRGRHESDLTPEEVLALARRRRAARVDAEAVDEILALNEHFTRWADGRSGSRPTLFLYLSSAPRSAAIFSEPSVVAHLPALDGKPLNVHRTWEHLLSLLYHVGDIEPGFDLRPAEEQLRNSRNFLTRLQQYEAQREWPSECGSDCWIRGGSGRDGSCGHHNFCNMWGQADEAMRGLRRKMANLSLGLHLGRFRSVLEAERGLVASGAPTEERLALLRRVLEDRSFSDLALERMGTLRKLANALVPASTEDITLATQYLPVAPGLSRPEYRAIWERLKDFWVAPAAQRWTRVELLASAEQAFHELPPPLRDGGEYELLRCLLYLGYPTEGGSTRAAKHASAMAERYPELAVEFFYVGCWAARRSGDLDAAEHFAESGLATIDGEPRLMHGLALVEYLRWTASDGKRPHSLERAIEYSRRAADAFEAASPRLQELLQANLNNLAYFRSLEPGSPTFDILGARDALDRLKAGAPKAEWGVWFPEFHHTEAHVEYQEYLHMLAGGASRDQLCAKIRCALREIRAAIAATPKKRYVELRENLERAASWNRCDS